MWVVVSSTALLWMSLSLVVQIAVAPVGGITPAVVGSFCIETEKIDEERDCSEDGLVMLLTEKLVEANRVVNPDLLIK